MNNREQVNEEATIDLGALFSAIWDKIVIIILAGVALACVAFLGTKLFITPTYDSTEELCSKISVANAADTRILAITVTDENPRMAQNIANQLRGAVAEQIQEVMRVDEVTVVEEANLPDRAARPSAFKNFAIGGVVGVFLAVAAVVLIFVMDDRIKTQEDVEKYLQLGILGTIPVVDEKGRKKSMKKTGKRKGRKQA